MDTKEKNIHRIVGGGIGYDAILWVPSGSNGTVADLGGLLETWQSHFRDKGLREEAGYKIQKPPLQEHLCSVYGLAEHPCVRLEYGDVPVSVDVVEGTEGCFLYHQQKVVKTLALAISKHVNDQTGVIQSLLNDEKIENPALYLVVDSEPNKNDTNPTMIHAVLYSQNKAEETWQELCEKLFTLLEKENLCPANLYDDLQNFLKATTETD